MFSKVIIVSALALSVAAGAIPRGNEYTCHTGPVQCCNRAAQSQTANGAAILSLIGLSAQGLTGMVGAECSPITVIGTGSGADCVTAPMCCENNKIKGLVSIGCTPISAKL